jgi:hypothetical protein
MIIIEVIKIPIILTIFVLVNVFIIRLLLVIIIKGIIAIGRTKLKLT